MFPRENRTFSSLVSDSNINHKLYNKRNKKLVSIHVRLGDYGNHLKTLFNLTPVESSYFTRAMGYIVEREPVSNYKILIHTAMMQLGILSTIKFHESKTFIYTISVF
jgi:hypothetical protein